MSDESEAVISRLREMNECVRIYLDMRDRGIPARPGWLEEEVAATDALLERQQQTNDNERTNMDIESGFTNANTYPVAADPVEELRLALVTNDVERAKTLIGGVWHEREGLRNAINHARAALFCGAAPRNRESDHE